MPAPTVTAFSSSRLNWMLIMWQNRAGLLTIGHDGPDRETWTLGSLKVALMKASSSGHWNLEAEAVPAARLSPRRMYCDLPRRMLLALNDPSVSIIELPKRLERARSELAMLPSVEDATTLLPELDSDDMMWLIIAAAAEERPLHLLTGINS